MRVVVHFLQSLATSSELDSDILVITLFPDTLTPFTSLNQYKTAYKWCFLFEFLHF
jgi:hypothetical protein